jgi:hypothetical protein
MSTVMIRQSEAVTCYIPYNRALAHDRFFQQWHCYLAPFIRVRVAEGKLAIGTSTAQFLGRLAASILILLDVAFATRTREGA